MTFKAPASSIILYKLTHLGLKEKQSLLYFTAPSTRQVQNAGHRSQVRSQGTGHRSQVTGYRAQGTGHRAQKTQ